MQEPDSKNNNERIRKRKVESNDEGGCWKVFMTLILILIGMATLVFGVCLVSFR